MGSINKSFLLLLILILAASSLMMAKPAFAKTIPTPSVPTFTVQPIGPSYTVPTTYSLNQSSGLIVAQLGYIVEYPNVQVTIKNQPFTPYFNESIGQEISLYYNIQVSPHGENSWTDIYDFTPYGAYQYYPEQSADSGYTNISIGVISGPDGQNAFIPVGAQTDIQVQAIIGYIASTYVPPSPSQPFTMGYTNYSFVGETSSWSNTETVTIPADIPLSPTPAPTSSPSALTPTTTQTSVTSASYASLLLIALVVIAVLLAVIVFLLLYVRKRKPNNSSQ